MTKEILLTPVRTSDTQNTSMVSPNTQTLYAPRANQEKPDEYGLVNFKQINELDEKTLNSAKAYTDSEITKLKEYVDEQDDKVLEDAKAYTYSKNEIDTKDANTLNSAKAYTDERIPATLNESYYTKQEVDERDEDTLNEAEEYTRAYTYDKATINNKVDDVKKLAEGNLKALSFDNDNQIKEWIAGTYTYTDTVTGEVITPDDTFIGQNIYNKNLTQSDYWVSKKPITKIEDLTILITDKSTLNASNVMFDSSKKNVLTATNVQDAIDEISSDFADKNFVYEHAGYQTQVDYNAILENNIIKCTLDETISDLELYNNTTYLIHIYLPLVTLTGELDDSYTFQLKDKDGNIINLNTIYQEDITNTANVGNMCQVQEYDIGIGYSWTFDAHYKIVTENNTTVRLFVTDTIIRETNTSMSGQALYTAINNSKLAPNTTVLCMSDYTSNGTTFTKGHNYKIIGDYSSGELILSWEDITPTSSTPSGEYVQETVTVTRDESTDPEAINPVTYSGTVKNEGDRILLKVDKYEGDGEIFIPKTLASIKLDKNGVTIPGLTQDYSIVENEPTDKSEGKMIYLRKVTRIGKCIVDKTKPNDTFYSSPDGLYSKITSGTITVTEAENYEYLISNTESSELVIGQTPVFVLGYINLGEIPALTQYTSGTTITLHYRLNGSSTELTDTLTLDSDSDMWIGSKLTVLKSKSIYSSLSDLSDDYYSVTIQDDKAFNVGSVTSIEITKLLLGDTSVIVRKDISEFDSSNLKIADGTQYKSLIEMFAVELQIPIIKDFT